MAEGTHALSDVLDDVEASAEGDSIMVQKVMDQLGHKSFAGVILVFALLAMSPASAVPGLTSVVATVVALMVAQMLFGRHCPWLPRFLSERTISTERVCKALSWLRPPVHFVERFLGRRFQFLVDRPWNTVTLLVMLAISCVMPFLEVIPASGSIAAAVIAFFAAGILVRDGVLVLIGVIFAVVLPFAVWWFVF